MEARVARLRDYDLAETAIGAVVVVVAVVLVVLVYTRLGSGGLSGYEIQARVPRADGLGEGTDVRLAGIKVGSLTDMTLDPQNYMVTLHMNIRNGVKIPDDSSLVVTSAGLLGSSYISITPGGDDKMLAQGGMIQNAQGSVDLMGLINRVISAPPPARPQQSKPQQNPGPSP